LTYETMSLERNTSCSRYPLTIRGGALPTIFESALLHNMRVHQLS
jgi:hypothetical protein